MKLKNQYLILITSLILVSSIFPDFWQVTMTGVISFFIAYLITKIKNINNRKS